MSNIDGRCYRCGHVPWFCGCNTAIPTPTFSPGYYSAPALTEEDVRRIVREEIAKSQEPQWKSA